MKLSPNLMLCLSAVLFCLSFMGVMLRLGASSVFKVFKTFVLSVAAFLRKVRLSLSGLIRNYFRYRHGLATILKKSNLVWCIGHVSAWFAMQNKHNSRLKLWRDMRGRCLAWYIESGTEINIYPLQVRLLQSRFLRHRILLRRLIRPVRIDLFWLATSEVLVSRKVAEHYRCSFERIVVALNSWHPETINIVWLAVCNLYFAEHVLDNIKLQQSVLCLNIKDSSSCDKRVNLYYKTYRLMFDSLNGKSSAEKLMLLDFWVRFYNISKYVIAVASKAVAGSEAALNIHVSYDYTMPHAQLEAPPAKTFCSSVLGKNKLRYVFCAALIVLLAGFVSKLLHRYSYARNSLRQYAQTYAAAPMHIGLPSIWWRDYQQAKSAISHNKYGVFYSAGQLKQNLLQHLFVVRSYLPIYKKSRLALAHSLTSHVDATTNGKNLKDLLRHYLDFVAIARPSLMPHDFIRLYLGQLLQVSNAASVLLDLKHARLLHDYLDDTKIIQQAKNFFNRYQAGDIALALVQFAIDNTFACDGNNDKIAAMNAWWKLFASAVFLDDFAPTLSYAKTDLARYYMQKFQIKFNLLWRQRLQRRINRFIFGKHDLGFLKSQLLPGSVWRKELLMLLDVNHKSIHGWFKNKLFIRYVSELQQLLNKKQGLTMAQVDAVYRRQPSSWRHAYLQANTIGNEIGLQVFRDDLLLPLRLLWDYRIKQLSNKLNLSWIDFRSRLDAGLLSSYPLAIHSQRNADLKQLQQLFSSQSPIKKWLIQNVDPLLNKTCKQWRSKKWLGLSFPLSAKFIAFTNLVETALPRIIVSQLVFSGQWHPVAAHNIASWWLNLNKSQLTANNGPELWKNLSIGIKANPVMHLHLIDVNGRHFVWDANGQPWLIWRWLAKNISYSKKSDVALVHFVVSKKPRRLLLIKLRSAMLCAWLQLWQYGLVFPKSIL